ncbi:ATP-grasp domain-containing protein [Jeotgalibacillus salarius]|uniref:ATP-grasp domain-containing protein n=1 Tax=Jeotgalibacillus salarius TaxID=546023 RepID=A0A4Y8LFQ4_9BACL|nr:ATP-grasp domain-containing protein [Jeotgalibacillus salarius]TFE01658.1 ATP-grasp domain-containing protein [Jeotgalibacillus salarius]
MNISTVLVTGIGGPTAQGILYSLQSLDDVRIIGADRRKITTGNQFCDKTYEISRYTSPENYIKDLKEIIEQEEVDAIFPSLHEELDLADMLTSELNIPVAIPESDYFQDLLDKEGLYKRMNLLHLDEYIPFYKGFSSNKEFSSIMKNNFQHAERVVVKEVRGYGAMGLRIVTNREGFMSALKKGESKVVSYDDYVEMDEKTRRIAMPYFSGAEFSVDVYVAGGKTVVEIPRERTGVSNGIVLEGKVLYKPELMKAAKKIGESLIKNGFFNLQFMDTEDGFKLTDLNPRFCGSQVMSLGANVNFPYLFIQHNVYNEPLKASPVWNVKMMRYRLPMFVKE